MTRRSFLGAVSAVSLSAWPAGATNAAAMAMRWPANDGHALDPWRTARDIVRSGALGRIVWGQVSGAGIGTGSAEDDDLRSLTHAMGIEGAPSRATRLAGGVRPAFPPDVTTILEFPAGQVIYLASAGRREVLVRGTAAHLRVTADTVIIVHA
jgi:hypothetical protein